MSIVGLEDSAVGVKKDFGDIHCNHPRILEWSFESAFFCNTNKIFLSLLSILVLLQWLCAIIESLLFIYSWVTKP